MLLSTLLIATTLGVPDYPPAPRAVVRYRIEQILESVVDLSAFGQGEQVQSQSFTWYLNATTSDSAGGKVFHAVVDSVQSTMVPRPTRDSMRGAVYHMVLDGSGKVTSLTNGAPTAAGSLLEAILRLLNPRVKAGAGPGATWVDTLDVTTDNPPNKTTTRTVTNFTMGGPEPYMGATARRVQTAASYVMNGTVQTPGGPADMEGSGSGTGSYYVGANGTLLGSIVTTTGNALVTMASAPAPIPAKTTTTVTVTVLK